MQFNNYNRLADNRGSASIKSAGTEPAFPVLCCSCALLQESQYTQRMRANAGGRRQGGGSCVLRFRSNPMC